MTASASDLRMYGHRSFQDEEIEERVLSSLREHPGTVTLADLVASTGLGSGELEPVLRSMIMRYDVAITVSDDGAIAYRFDPSLTPTDGGDALRRYRFRKALWAAFKVFYKILIVVVLVGYVIAFLVLMVMAFVAAQNDREDNRGGGRRQPQGGGMGGNFWIWYWMFGNRRAPQPRRSRYDATPKQDPRPIWEKVFSFVFGLDTSEDDPLVDRRQMLAYLVRERGVVAPMELSARTGWSPEASERESSKLLANFDGGVEILPDGQTLFIFDDLRDAVPPGTRPLPLYYERFERRASNSGNPVSTDFLIGGLNLFVLVSALFFAPSIIIPSLVTQYGVTDIALLRVLLIIIPGIFSLSFFAIPMVRNLFTTRKENEARAARNARRLAMRSVYNRVLRGETAFRESDILEDSLSRRMRSNEAIFDRDREAAVTHALRDIAHEWHADQDVNDAGERVYDFSVLAQQYQEARRYRQNPDAHNAHRMDEEFRHFDELLAETAPQETA